MGRNFYYMRKFDWASQHFHISEPQQQLSGGVKAQIRSRPAALGAGHQHIANRSRGSARPPTGESSLYGAGTAAAARRSKPPPGAGPVRAAGENGRASAGPRREGLRPAQAEPGGCPSTSNSAGRAIGQAARLCPPARWTLRWTAEPEQARLLSGASILRAGI